MVSSYQGRSARDYADVLVTVKSILDLTPFLHLTVVGIAVENCLANFLRVPFYVVDRELLLHLVLGLAQCLLKVTVDVIGNEFIQTLQL